MNADFDTIYSWINGGGAIWNDASVAFTNVPSGPNADPTSANHLTRKSYVDGKLETNINGIIVPLSTQLRLVFQQYTIASYVHGGSRLGWGVLGFTTPPMALAVPFGVPGLLTNVLINSTDTSGFNFKIFNGATEVSSGGAYEFTVIALGS